MVVAILTILTIYHLSQTRDWDSAANISVDRLKNLASNPKEQQQSALGAKPGQGQSDKQEAAKGEKAPAQLEKEPTKTVTTSKAVVQDQPVLATVSSSSLSSSSTSAPDAKPTKFGIPSDSGKTDETTDPDTEPAIPHFPPPKLSDKFGQHGQGRLDDQLASDGIPLPRWKKQKEQFPIPSESLIPLPTGKAKKIPAIQKLFKDETVAQKTDRERKQAAVKDAFVHAWSGYVKKAIPHDELKPLSGDHNDPFNGWGATLVDSLDSLWIMGLKTEFEEALEYVKKIDFLTSRRKDIPLFETVIRYLGGLIAAYDISNQQYKPLLDKAVELAEMLMGAFDTPNRMPQTFYYWAPSYSSQPHRAGTRVVMAELGSLSLEFTRLAQLTRENKYYDAVARITNEFEIYQNKTRLPGIWPLWVDASGCRKPERQFDSTVIDSQTPIHPPVNSVFEKERERAAVPLNLINEEPVVNSVIEKERNAVTDALGEDTASSVKSTTPSTADKSLHKRAAIDASSTLDTSEMDNSVEATNSTTSPVDLQAPKIDTTKLARAPPPALGLPDPTEVDCEPQGLANPPHSSSDTFALGAMADSTFEYLPKMYMLLGGQLEQYQSMYEYFVKSSKESLIYRAMTKDEDRNILFAGKLEVPDQSGPYQPKTEMEYEVTHLTCFAGGMFGVGAQVFGLDGDLDIARGLSDGCVWAYESTASGIMPESAQVVACDSMEKCPWNETKWWDALDPNSEQRMQQTEDWNAQQKEIYEQLAADEAREKANTARSLAIDDAEAPQEILTRDNTEYTPASEDPSSSGRLAKRGSVGERPTFAKGKIQKEYVSAEPGANPVKDDAPANSVSNAESGPGIYQGKIKKVTDEDEEPGVITASSVNEADAAGATAGRPADKPTMMKGKIAKIGVDSDGKISNKEYEKATTMSQPTKTTIRKEYVAGPGDDSANAMKSLFTPIPVVTHEEYAKKRIAEQRLPEGFTQISGKKYMLRPEAIESVFIMYRITGEEYWREKGWKMFNAVQKATRTEFANSAVWDVTSEIPEPDDTMESFWLAETLKYFYLLFSDPSVVSLDDWVL